MSGGTSLSLAQQRSEGHGTQECPELPQQLLQLICRKLPASDWPTLSVSSRNLLHVGRQLVPIHLHLLGTQGARLLFLSPSRTFRGCTRLVYSGGADPEACCAFAVAADHASAHWHWLEELQLSGSCFTSLHRSPAAAGTYWKGVLRSLCSCPQLRALELPLAASLPGALQQLAGLTQLTQLQLIVAPPAPTRSSRSAAVDAGAVEVAFADLEEPVAVAGAADAGSSSSSVPGNAYTGHLSCLAALKNLRGLVLVGPGPPDDDTCSSAEDESDADTAAAAAAEGAGSQGEGGGGPTAAAGDDSEAHAVPPCLPPGLTSLQLKPPLSMSAWLPHIKACSLLQHLEIGPADVPPAANASQVLTAILSSCQQLQSLELLLTPRQGQPLLRPPDELSVLTGLTSLALRVDPDAALGSFTMSSKGDWEILAACSSLKDLRGLVPQSLESPDVTLAGVTRLGLVGSSAPSALQRVLAAVCAAPAVQHLQLALIANQPDPVLAPVSASALQQLEMRMWGRYAGEHIQKALCSGLGTHLQQLSVVAFDDGLLWLQDLGCCSALRQLELDCSSSFGNGSTDEQMRKLLSTAPQLVELSYSRGRTAVTFVSTVMQVQQALPQLTLLVVKEGLGMDLRPLLIPADQQDPAPASSAMRWPSQQQQQGQQQQQLQRSMLRSGLQVVREGLTVLHQPSTQAGP